VKASAPFTSAPEGDHLCAVVSLYNPATGYSVDAMTALEIPNPGYSDTHQCSAWRNTDSMYALMGSGFRFGVGLGNLPFRFEEPIILNLTTTHIPATVLREPVINNLQNTVRALGATPNLPVYLLPGFEREFEAADLKPKLSPTKGLRLEERSPGEWHLFPHGEDRAAALEIQGEVPASATAGDVMLVNVTAQYPACGAAGWVPGIRTHRGETAATVTRRDFWQGCRAAAGMTGSQTMRIPCACRGSMKRRIEDAVA
jgi:hypothetical protein